MELTFEDLEDGVRRINLSGRLDVEGTQQIDLKFTSLAASGQAFVVVDMSNVDFISSIGLGTLVRSAAAQMLRKGKLVVLRPQPNVERVFETTRVNEVITIFHDREAAHQAVREAAVAANA